MKTKKLKNGAYQISKLGNYVLAWWPKNNHMEFITWRLMKDGSCEHGNYYNALVYGQDEARKLAKADLRERHEGSLAAEMENDERRSTNLECAAEAFGVDPNDKEAMKILAALNLAD